MISSFASTMSGCIFHKASARPDRRPRYQVRWTRFSTAAARQLDDRLDVAERLQRLRLQPAFDDLVLLVHTRLAGDESMFGRSISPLPKAVSFDQGPHEMRVTYSNGSMTFSL